MTEGWLLVRRPVIHESGPKTLSPTSYWAESRCLAAGGLCATVMDLHQAESRLSAVGGGLFFAADQPSIELHLQAQDHEALAYGRYHNGWFVGLAMRDGPSGNRIHRRGSGT